MGKRLIPFMLSIIIIFSSTVVFGERIFTDVSQDYWAYAYIKKVVDLGLMDGYEDATFRPGDLVNTVDALVYISRLANIGKKEVDEKALREELSNHGEMKKATKLEICKYMAIAMGFKEEEQNTSQIFLYNDISDIPISERPYVKFLIDEGVLDKRGDESGNFNPNQEINRAVLAKMLSQAYDAISGKSTIEVERISKPEETDEIEEVDLVEEIEYEEISGTILMILKGFLIVDIEDEIDSYIIAEDAEIIIDGEEADIESLQEEMDVKLFVSQDKKVERIEVENQVIYGVIDEINLGEEPYLIVEMEIGHKRTFDLSNNPKVVLDGRDAYLFSLDEGDKVAVEALEDKALSITGERREGRVIGTLSEKPIDGEWTILVERENGSIYEYEVNLNATINRDLNRVKLESLRVSDELIMILKDGEVNRIDAYSTPGEDRGYIKSILISHEPVLTIEREDGNIVSYYISNNTNIAKDKIMLSIYDLRLGDMVDLELKSDEIVNLKVEQK